MSAAVFNDPLTRSVEDYLKAIYRLSRSGEPASTSDLAAHLQVAAPSVSGMIKRLSDHGLVDHEPYRGAQLTLKGREVALRIVRRHRILEAFLVGLLGYGWEEVHEEAERLEHAVSDALIQRMAKALGDPHFDPHGDPIPDADGRIPEEVHTPLSDIPVGVTVEVRRADTSNTDHLRYIASFGLTPGARAQVVDRQPFHGPLTVLVQGSRQILGEEIARLLLCVQPEPGA